MSEDQFAALLARLRDDAELRQKLGSAVDLEAATAVAKEAGFEVSQADWLQLQPNREGELDDAELESLAGGMVTITTITVTVVVTDPGTCQWFSAVRCD